MLTMDKIECVIGAVTLAVMVIFFFVALYQMSKCKDGECEIDRFAEAFAFGLGAFAIGFGGYKFGCLKI